MTNRLRSAALLAAAFAFTTAGRAQCPTNNAIPGKFYEWYIIAATGCNGLTALGQGPSINDFGEVAFMGQTSAGQTIWTGTGRAAPTNINPGSAGSSEFFDASLDYNNNEQIVTKDSITTTSPATTSIRVWNATAQNSFRYVARGGPHQSFNAIFPFPGINNKGGVAAMALSGTQTYLLEQPQGGALAQFPVKVSVGEPAIDDNGDVLLYQQTTTPANGFQLMLYQNNLTTFTVIADYNLFTSIDYVPGISSDGMVIAFEGNLSPTGAMTLGTTSGPGIFAATNEGGGVWHITRVTGIQAEVLNSGGNNDGICDRGEVCVPAAELGFDDNGNALYFNTSGYPAGSRIAVTDLGLGASGIDDDTFVISFAGTPSAASRINPVTKSMPLFFSANQGLWTIRVDVQHQLSAPNNRVYHPATAIPVVQIGDMISGQIVAAIGINDQIGNAAKDETNKFRTMRRGDHRVAFWISTQSGQQMIVRGNHLDSDQDGLLDHWETTGIDMDQDGIVDLDLPAMGANPNIRDLFVEMDWIADQGPAFGFNFQPTPGVVSPLNGQSISPLVSMFNLAPTLSGNEYGALYNGGTPASIHSGITLHIDGGPGNDVQGQPLSLNMINAPLDGGSQIGLTGNGSTGLPEVIYFGKPNSITIPGVGTRAFQDIKDNYFGSKDKDGRELAFHYIVFGDYFLPRADASGAMSWQVASAGSNYLNSASPLPFSSQGDVVKITAGTGAGQERTVLGFNPNNQIVLYDFWATVPDSSSTFTIFAGNLGQAEIFINPTPDYNSLPGNDVILAFGPFSQDPLTDYNTFLTNSGEHLLATECEQWRTVAHELGHTLGLRHGGTDNNSMKGPNYLSLMSYSWSLMCASPVTSYSGSGDPTYDDWANLQGDFPNAMIHLGNTIGAAYGTFPEVDQMDPEQTGIDYMNENGPPGAPPTVKITSPAANAKVGLNSPLQVTVNATGSSLITSATVSFDVNGDGILQPAETIAAKATGTNLYKANFPALTGPAGTRTISASAVDATGLSTTVMSSVSVVQPNPVPSLTALSPSSAAHGGPTFTLTITGSNFVSGAAAQWNGVNLATTFVNSGKVTANVPSSDIVNPGTAQVTVKNPAPGGGVSNALTFTIN